MCVSGEIGLHHVCFLSDSADRLHLVIFGQSDRLAQVPTPPVPQCTVTESELTHAAGEDDRKKGKEACEGIRSPTTHFPNLSQFTITERPYGVDEWGCVVPESDDRH